MASSTVSSILEDIASAGKAYGNGTIGSRESLIDLSQALVAALEIPSEFIQRSFWAEVGNPIPALVVLGGRSAKSCETNSLPSRHTSVLLSTSRYFNIYAMLARRVSVLRLWPRRWAPMLLYSGAS
jgi:hypothetical protein